MFSAKGRRGKKCLRMLDLILGKSQKNKLEFIITLASPSHKHHTGNKHQSFALACAFELEAFNAMVS